MNGYMKESADFWVMTSRLLIAVVTTCHFSFANAEAPLILDLAPGNTIDAYFEVNVKGKVFVRLGAKPGQAACADFWWIKWPLGTIESLGRRCDFAEFDIPGFTSFAISAKLRSGGATNPIKIGIADSITAANSIKFSF